MIKIIAAMKRNPNLTQEEFELFYNTKHAPFAKSLMGDNLFRYVRNFRRADSPFRPVDSPPLVRTLGDFDCVTEFHYENEDKFKRAIAAVTDERIVQRLRAEEAHMVDTATFRMSVVEVREDTDGRP